MFYGYLTDVKSTCLHGLGHEHIWFTFNIFLFERFWLYWRNQRPICALGSGFSASFSTRIYCTSAIDGKWQPHSHMEETVKLSILGCSAWSEKERSLDLSFFCVSWRLKIIKKIITEHSIFSVRSEFELSPSPLPHWSSALAPFPDALLPHASCPERCLHACCQRAWGQGLLCNLVVKLGDLG